MSPRSLVPVQPFAPRAAPLAQVAATLLRAAGALLEHLAERLAADARHASAARAMSTQVEFHAEAGAPEGALYADGVLVGVLPGVTRL